ncbi:MAG: hypothetical protein LC637_12980, partial [Xanthomonadaceae bacterium]|nr:hypothetical protein [Xanthomonadaceae bacterium]
MLDKRTGGLLLACLLVFLTACQHLAERDSSAAEAETETEQSAGQGVPDQSEPDSLTTFELAIRHLQDGDAAAARSILDRLLDQQPDAELIPALLGQIDLPVAALLPGPYREVEVEPGESLSLIAQRELGDALMFYALARLNGIEVPRRVVAGTRIRVPERKLAAKQEGSSAAASASGVDELATVVKSLVAIGQAEAARDLLAAAIDTDGGRRQPERTDLLARLTLDQAAALQQQGRNDEALLMIEKTMRVVGQGQSAGAPMAREARRLRADRLYRQAVSLADDGDNHAAIVRVRQALELEPAIEGAQTLESELGQALIDELHGTALRAWRDRDVDLAIRNWQMLRVVMPD